MKAAVALILSLVVAWPGHLMAQEISVPAISAPPEAPVVVSEVVPRNIAVVAETKPRSPFVERLLEDQKDLWLSPFKIKKADVKWLVPLGAGAAFLLTQDRKWSDSARSAEGIRPASHFFSKLGGGAPLTIASGTLWGAGKLTHDAHAAKTGQMAAEAVFHTQLAVGGLKKIFNRERPNKLDGQGQFWGGGQSFPSGHAATSFAFATVVADQYKNKPVIAIGAYGLATAVSLSRIGGLNHHPSDVLVGAVIGHLIGKFILHRHKDKLPN